MNKIVEFWESNKKVLEMYEEDFGINGRDYILSIDNIEELKEVLKDYLE